MGQTACILVWPWCTYITSQHCTTGVIFADKANPSLGDLCLEQGSKGIVQVYYADNFNSVGWGTMCDDLVDQSALDTMCKQLGYDTSPASM